MTLNNGCFGGIAAVLAAVLGLGCGDSSGSTVSNSDSDSKGDGSSTMQPTSGPTEASGSVSMSATESNDGGLSESLSGTTADDGGVSDSLSNGGGSGNESVSGSGETSADTGQISGGGETSASSSEGGETSTGGPSDCPEVVDEAMCEAAGCQAVLGQQFVDDDAIICLKDQAVFLGCIPPSVCDAVITTVCKGDAQYQLPSGCKPGGFSECAPPPDQGMDGYPSCS